VQFSIRLDSPHPIHDVDALAGELRRSSPKGVRSSTVSTPPVPGSMGGATELVMTLLSSEVIAAVAGIIATWLGVRRRVSTIHLKNSRMEISISVARRVSRRELEDTIRLLISEEDTDA